MRSAIDTLLSEATRRLKAAGVDSPRLDARVLLMHVLGLPGNALISDQALCEEQVSRFETLVGRRIAREPLAYIVGEKEFFSLAFAVGPGVLVPRPETETLVEEAIRAFPDRDADLDVLDLGTGTGCIIAAFLSHYPRARGVAVDDGPDALVWATRNIERLGLSPRCDVLRGTWNAKGRFDVVFSNPPYLTEDEYTHAAPEIRCFEPKTAFVAGRGGLDAYRGIARALPGQLKPDGLVFLEVGASQSSAVVEILEADGLESRGISPDLGGIPRCVIAGRRG